MLGNNEPIAGIDLADVFAAMLRELPWNSLRAYLQANAPLLKRCTVGGHRLETKHRKRFEQLLLQEARKCEFAQSFYNAIFAYWYPVHEELHQKLEGYFHSDQYTEYRQANEIDEDAYVLSPDKFAEFFDPKDLPRWRILLCFSPLRMTPEQAEQVLQNAGGNEVLIKQVDHLKEDLAHALGDKERLANENKEMRTRLEKLAVEVQELRNERKGLKKESETLAARCETAQAESRRWREESATRAQEVQQAQKVVKDAIAREAAKFERDLSRLNDELDTWRKNYEKQRVLARESQEALETAEKTLAGKEQQLQERHQQVNTLQQFADAILARLDWQEIARQLKTTPLMTRKLNSLIKKLNYEEDRSLSLGGTLEQFWTALQEEESRLVHAIAQSDVHEVQQGNVEAYWRGLTDVFEDVHISLEARGVLLHMLQEIFYQTLEMEDLEKVRLPTP